MTPEEMGLSAGMLGLMLLLSIVTLVSFIWTLVIAFKENILWGLGSLFVPLVIIVFGIMHWDKAKKPFLTYVIASIVYAVFFFNVISTMFTEAGVMELNSQVRSGQITEQEAQQRIQQRMAEMFGTEAEQVPGAQQPQQAEDQINTLTGQMNERARQAEQQADAPATQRIKVYNSIRVSQARQYIGENVRVISMSGVEKQGTLKEVKYDRLVLERNLRGGDFAFEVLFNDIKSIEVEQWETY